MKLLVDLPVGFTVNLDEQTDGLYCQVCIRFEEVREK